MWQVCVILLSIAVITLSAAQMKMQRKLNAIADIAAAALDEVDHG